MQAARLSRELRGVPGLGKAPDRAPGGRGTRDLEAAGRAELRLECGAQSRTLDAGNPSTRPPHPRPARLTPSLRQPAPLAVGRSFRLARGVPAAALAQALGCGLPAARESMARPVQLAPGSLALVLAAEEPGGRAVFRAFRRANARCFWNARLARAASRLAFQGWLRRGVLLVCAPPACLQVLRDAWRRRGLRPPRGFRIRAGWGVPCQLWSPSSSLQGRARPRLLPQRRGAALKHFPETFPPARTLPLEFPRAGSGLRPFCNS
ncbi:hypothetical protein P7K49_024002 [Saguinus oedipus]|uniref:Storkhead-box protein 1 n=1 Tax=Saguinus oedipus TaxID=9490 RepID=A0ABQ9UN91_SAGOE|nr:hypothetical protein P7K49_024002 [Saguinus oedipus]